jgi:hypothetical protein
MLILASKSVHHLSFAKELPLHGSHFARIYPRSGDHRSRRRKRRTEGTEVDDIFLQCYFVHQSPTRPHARTPIRFPHRPAEW